MLLGDGEPFGARIEFLLISGEIKGAALGKAHVLANLILEAAPDAQSLHDHGHFGGIASLLPHEAPVAARLLAGDAPLFAKRDGEAALGEKPGGRTADDAAADDHHIDGLGQRRAIEFCVAHHSLPRKFPGQPINSAPSGVALRSRPPYMTNANN